jgi:hypothetical protein
MTAINKMKKIASFLFAACCLTALACPALAENYLDEESLYSDNYQAGGNYKNTSGNNPKDKISFDTEDPLFMLKTGYILSRTTLTLTSHSIARLSEQLSIGVNDHLTILADIGYQQDFDQNRTGFSGPNVAAIYRILRTGILTDLFAGAQFGGAERIPEFASNRYYIGTRVGKQWSWMTLAGTLQASWIFDEAHGHAYIDLIPEAYFRLFYDWSLGAVAGIRKSTTPHFDQEWLGARLAKRYGRTMYVGFTEYEFEHEEWRFGFRLNILF